ncbi:hypothetical protein BpHYR1_035032, partial [Brachionus plicatilis]
EYQFINSRYAVDKFLFEINWNLKIINEKQAFITRKYDLKMMTTLECNGHIFIKRTPSFIFKIYYNKHSPNGLKISLIKNTEKKTVSYDLRDEEEKNI